MERREPTDREICLIASAATQAAMGKVDELGLGLDAYMLGIIHAANSSIDTLRIVEVIGVEGLHAAAETIRKSQLYDTLAEAEEIIKGEAPGE